jgi:hypothetical protein
VEVQAQQFAEVFAISDAATSGRSKRSRARRKSSRSVSFNCASTSSEVLRRISGRGLGIGCERYPQHLAIVLGKRQVHFYLLLVIRLASGVL